MIKIELELTKTQADLLEGIIEEEIKEVESMRFEYRGQLLASLRSLYGKVIDARRISDVSSVV